jgi:folate-binding Fe-S cluster repair protein YgfZ
MTTASEMEAVTMHLGLVDRSDRVRLEISGPDRAKFLHNLTTNEIKRLPVGRGCETFVTSPQGKTIGYLIVLAADDKLIARADPGGDALALPHFQKYGVFDDVAIYWGGDGRLPSAAHTRVAGAPSRIHGNRPATDCPFGKGKSRRARA